MNFSQSTVFSIVSSFGLLFINLFISVIEARVLGPQEIGRYHVYITTQTYVSTLCALGIGQSCIFFINKLGISERRVLATSVNASLILALVAGIVMFGAIQINHDYFGNDSVLYVSLFCIGSSAMLLNNIFTPVLLTKMEVVRNQIVKYSTRTITLLVIGAIIIWGRRFDVGFLIGLTGVTNVIAMMLLYYYYHNRFSFKDGIDKPLLGRITIWGIKLSGNNIASVTLSSLPIYFLTWFSSGNGLTNVGYYSRANSLLVVGTVIASSIGPLLYSKWSGASDIEIKEQVRRFSFLYLVINALIAFGLLLAAPLLIKLLYGAEFYSATPILQLLAFSLLGNGIKEICYGVLSSRGYPLKILKNLCIGIVFTAIADFLVIPFLGAVGCSIVTLLATSFTAILLMKEAEKVSLIKFEDFFVVPSRNSLKYVLSQIIHKS